MISAQAIWSGVLTDDLADLGDQLQSWVIFRYESFRIWDLDHLHSNVEALISSLGLSLDAFPMDRIKLQGERRLFQYHPLGDRGDGDYDDVIIDPKYIPLVDDLAWKNRIDRINKNPFDRINANLSAPCRDMVAMIEDVFSYDLDNDAIPNVADAPPIFLSSRHDPAFADVTTKLRAFDRTGAAATCAAQK